MTFLEEACFPIEIIKGKLKKEKLPNIDNYSKSKYCEKLLGCAFFIRLDFAQRNSFLDENVFLVIG